MIRTSRRATTYGRCLPRVHEVGCPAPVDACVCSAWWRGREFVRQMHDFGYTRLDDGWPYDSEDAPPEDESLPPGLYPITATADTGPDRPVMATTLAASGEGTWRGLEGVDLSTHPLVQRYLPPDLVARLRPDA